MRISHSVSSKSSSSDSSRVSGDSNEPAKKGTSDLSQGSKTPSKSHSARLGQVQKDPSTTSAESETTSIESEAVSSDSSSGENTQISHEDTLGVNLSPVHHSDSDDELDPPPGPKKKPQKPAVDLDAIIEILPDATAPLPKNAATYSTVRASWPGAAAYAGSFMMARAAQFALTVSGNPMGSAIAFATLAGTLHIGMEPIVGALRSKMGMRSDRDTKNFTNFVTALAMHVDSSIRNDPEGMNKAEKLARESLAPYFGNWDKQNDPMPPVWHRARTMLTAGARGFASNELPFYMFAAVYLLTNPAGLWIRTSLMSADINKDLAMALELVMSVTGGALAGIGTVGVQNMARRYVQGADHAPLRGNIKLARLNQGILKLTRNQLELLKKALKASLREPVVEPAKQDDLSAVADSISEVLNLRGGPNQFDLMRTRLEQLPSAERKALLEQVRVKLNKTELTQKAFNDGDDTRGARPYSLSGAMANGYQEMVATKDSQGVYQLDRGKIQRVIARTACNVLGLTAYGAALVHALGTIGGYGPANEPPHVNASLPHDPAAFPTTEAQAYGEMASLGVSLITCWVGARALAPALELTMAPLTGVAGRVGSAVWSAGSSAADAVRNHFVPAPITNGPPQEDAPPPDGVQIV